MSFQNLFGTPLWKPYSLEEKVLYNRDFFSAEFLYGDSSYNRKKVSLEKNDSGFSNKKVVPTEMV